VFDRRDLKGRTRDSFSKWVEAGELVRVDQRGSFELYREAREPETPEPARE
jgi:hypothetical protein